MADVFQLHDATPEGVRAVKFSGRMDVADWERFFLRFRKLVADGETAWDLDLGGLTMLNSQDIGMVVRCQASLAKAEGRLRLFAPEGSKILELLRYTKVDQIIEVQSSPN